MSKKVKVDRGVWVSIDILRQSDITPVQKFILSEINHLSNLGLGCIANNKHFMNKFAIGNSSVTRALNALHELGYIEIDDTNTVRNFGRVIVSNCEIGDEDTTTPKKTNTKFCDTGIVNNAFEITWLEHKDYRKGYNNTEHGAKGKAHTLYKTIVQSMYDEFFTGKSKLDDKYIPDIFENMNKIIHTYRHGIQTKYLQNILDPSTILERLENMEF